MCLFREQQFTPKIQVLYTVIGATYLGQDPFSQEGVLTFNGALYMLLINNSMNMMYAVIEESIQIHIINPI